METKKIRVCVIGAGRAGMIHARNFARGVPNATLAAVADPVGKATQKACRELELEKYYLDYHDVMQDDDIDAVVVVSPTVYHKEIVVAAARAGKHILCEKPMAMTVEECDAMNSAVEEHHVKLQIGFMRRFDKSFMYAKERILAGEIGDVVLVKSLTRGPSIPRPWQYDVAKSNGPLAEVNSHDIDTLRWFTESEFKEVYAIAGNYRCPQAKDNFPDFYDNVVMSASFENGMQGCIDGAVSVRYGYDARTEIVGTKGVVFVGRLRENDVVVCSQDSGIVTPFMETWRTLFIDAYRREDEEFIESIIENKTPRVTGIDGKMAVKVVNAGNQSIVEKRPIVLT
jgi:myo-inositol 2-dehydrogenase/D-chiro-inositol 1-dehydrogenase/scyllo-inositol 2-dehydrogenase (NAD+)